MVSQGEQLDGWLGLKTYLQIESQPSYPIGIIRLTRIQR